MALLKKLETSLHSGKAGGGTRSRPGRSSGGTQRILQPPTKARSKLPRGSLQGRGGSPEGPEAPLPPSGQESYALLSCRGPLCLCLDAEAPSQVSRPRRWSLGSQSCSEQAVSAALGHQAPDVAST